ncbi:MAG TPA: hypothetical protein VMV69_17455 [Pirellulales bacterium]|nr:hypothetical protein [Pirellulales bacterium]
MPRSAGGSHFVRGLFPYLAALALCLLLLSQLVGFGQLDLSVPLAYFGDALQVQAMVKSIADHGWFLTNPRLGAPGVLKMHDFPMTENLHLLVIKALLCGGADWPLAVNLFFLLTFPLATVTSLFAMRRFGIAAGPAVVASLLFAFLPYHWLRNVFHLFLAAYYLVPLSVMVALWIFLGRLGAGRREGPALQGPIPEPPAGGTPAPQGRTWDRLPSQNDYARLWASLLVCLLHSAAGVYYAFFACYFFAVAGVAAGWRRRALRPLAIAALCIGTTVAGLLANGAPSLWYWYRHGGNREVGRRGRIEAEILGLKIAPLVLPVMGHRWKPLAKLREVYNNSSINVNESAFATLGFVGAAGFLALLARILFATKTRRGGLLDALAALNLAAILLSTVGGFGVLFNFLHPQIRGYNRICVYISFFALLAVAQGLQWLQMRCAGIPLARAARHGVLALVLAIGILDQSPPATVPVAEWGMLPRAEAIRHFNDDAAFVARLEASLPEGGMVYQMAYMPFPEGLPVHRMGSYDHLMPYLHSKTLRWSYGGIKGRPGDRWLEQLEAVPLPRRLETLVMAGFVAIYVDRDAYDDQARSLEAELRTLLGVEPMECRGRRQFCFSLLPYAQSLREKLGRSAWRRRVRLVLATLPANGALRPR